MHKIAACIAWHTLNDRFIIVALVQISIVKSYVSMGVIFLIWGFVNLKQLSHADTFNLVSISYLKNVCRSLTEFSFLNEILKLWIKSMHLVVVVKMSSFVVATVRSWLSCSLLVLPVIRWWFICSVRCLICGVLDYRPQIQWPLAPTDTTSPLLLITLK